MSDTIIAVSGILLVVGSLLVIAGSILNYKARMAELEAIHTEAVENGWAEWVPDKEGNTTFKWKEVAK